MSKKIRARPTEGVRFSRIRKRLPVSKSLDKRAGIFLQSHPETACRGRRRRGPANYGCSLMAKTKCRVVVRSEYCKGCNLCIVYCKKGVLATSEASTRPVIIRNPRRFEGVHRLQGVRSGVPRGRHRGVTVNRYHERQPRLRRGRHTRGMPRLFRLSHHAAERAGRVHGEHLPENGGVFVQSESETAASTWS